jgi:Prolyl oligopeptidase family/Inner membrane component of T3SS, cytoplasmic domain
VDTNRLGIGGGSYGGYMTNWAIGQTNRFSAAVSMRSISNLVSEYAQHDIVLWGTLELGPPPWPDLDELWRRSPIRYVQNIRTPLLLTCGEMDLRCAISQSEELFGAMRLLGKTVEMVRFPEESHDLSRNGRPDRRVERLRRISAWFERFLGTAATDPISEAATQLLPVPTFATRELPSEPAMPAPTPMEPAVPDPTAEEAVPEPVYFEPAALAELPAPAPEAELETDTMVLQTLASVEPVADVAASEAELAEPEALPDLPEPEAVGEAEAEPEPVAELEGSLTPALPLAGEATDGQVESEAVVEPEVEPDVEAGEPTELESPPTPAAVPLAGEGVEAGEPEASEPWLQAEQDSDPGREPEQVHEPEPEPEPAPELEPLVAAVESEPEPQPEPEPTEPPVAAEVEPAPEPAVMAAEPEPSAQSTQVTRPPVPNPDDDRVRSTMVRWPGSTSPGNGSPTSQPETFEEATSIIPAWQHSEAPSDSRRTVSLQAVPIEQIAAGTAFAALLTFESGPFAGRIVALPSQMVTVGRAPDNEVVVGDPATSGHHGRIEVRNGFFWISDLGSTNGTLVNGEPVIEKQLSDGDLIAIGQNTMRFSLES